MWDENRPGEESGSGNGKRYTDLSDTRLSPRVRRHLAATYGHLAITASLAAFTCWLQISGLVSAQDWRGLGTSLAGVGVLWAIQLVPRPQVLRQALLYSFGLLEGIGLAPTVSRLYYFEPGLLLSALAMTAAVFVAFTATALLSPRRSQFYLFSVVSAMFLVLLLGGLLNGFVRSLAVDNGLLYLGLGVFALLVTLDTQLIVERVEANPRQDPDAVLDAANMLVNIVGILRRMLLVLARQRDSEDRRRRHRR